MINSPLKVIVLAAGKGTRMKSFIPKVCHTLGGRAMLAYVLETAHHLGPEKVITIVAPDMPATKEVAEACANDLGASIETVLQESQQGTGHAVLSAKQHLENYDGNILVLFGDTPLLTQDTLSSMIAAKNDAAIVVLGMRPVDGGQYGRIVTNAADEVEQIVEYADATDAQRQITLCNSGVMLIDGSVALDLLQQIKCDNTKGEYYLTDIVEIATRQSLSVRYVEGSTEELLGINSRHDLAKAEQVLQNRWRNEAMTNGATLSDPASTFFSYDTQVGQDVTIGPNVVFGPGVLVEDNVTIKPFCKFEGVHIKSGAFLGPFAHIRPGTIVGTDAKIGNFVEIKESTIHSGAKISHLSYIGDAEVGAGTNIGAGTITCNYDGFHKYKTIIGEHAYIGANTALIAPIEIGDKTVIGAGSVVTNDVPANALAVARVAQTEISGGATKYRRKRSQLKVIKNKED